MPFPLIADYRISVACSGKGYNLRALEVAVGNGEGSGSRSGSGGRERNAHGAIATTRQWTGAGGGFGKVSSHGDGTEVEGDR